MDRLAGRGVSQQRSGSAELERNDRKTAESERKGERRRSYEDIIRSDVEYFPGITIRDDQKIAMKMHRGFWFARGARGKSQQGDIIPAGLDRIESDRLVQRPSIQLGV